MWKLPRSDYCSDVIPATLNIHKVLGLSTIETRFMFRNYAPSNIQNRIFWGGGGKRVASQCIMQGECVQISQ